MNHDIDIRVRVSKDRMEAWVKLVKVAGSEEIDTTGSAPIQDGSLPGVLEVQEPHQDGETAGGIQEGERVTEEQVLAVLEARGIVFGLDREAVRRVAEEGPGEEICVARGDAPRPGRDAVIQCLFAAQVDEGTKEEGRVDLLDFNPIISVDAGTVLAVRQPPVPGEPGTDVLGQEVPAPKVKDAILKAGSGVVLEDGGNKALAAVDGRPEQKGSLFTVYPVYTLPGNVDAATGHIKFKGDLVVKGNVMDGMRVEARGRIEVLGMVAQSTVVAGGEVVVHKNILGSTVRAGGPWILLKKAQDHLVKVGSMLETLLVAAQQMKSHANFATNPQVVQYGEGIILKVLLERKYTEIPAAITGLIEHLETLEKEVLDGEIVAGLLALVRDLYTKLSGLGPLQFKRLEDLVGPIQAIRREVDRFADHVHGAAGHTAQITVSYVQNSRLEASGVVRVTGKGAYYCDILAGGGVVVDGTPGIFRNGTISAGGDVLVRELGSPSEALTSVQVPKEAVITADRLHPGVTLKAGARVEKFRNYTAGVRFHQ